MVNFVRPGKLLGGSTKAITLGTSPYDNLLKGKRRLAIASVSPAASRTYDPVIERAAQYFVRSLETASKSGGPIDPFPLFVDGSAVLNLTVICGATIDQASNLLKDCPYPMKRLGQSVYPQLSGTIRNINGHLRDFLPFLRILPEGKTFKEASIVAKYRSARLTDLLERIRLLHTEGKAHPCAVATILDESQGEIHEDSLTSVANSMVSSGLDAHMPNTLLWGLGVLAARDDVQRKAYEAIISQEKLGDGMNWERDNYLFAFVKELGRYFNTFRLALARETIGKDLVWRGHFIPEGTTTLSISPIPTSSGLNVTCTGQKLGVTSPTTVLGLVAGYAYYYISVLPLADIVGRRNCPAINLVQKELYMIYKHILLNWSLRIYDGESEFDAIKGCADGLEFNQGPKAYRILLEVRDQQKLDSYLNTRF
ncbi:hypothetical protein C0992_006635 [Termitomyces sp. T32_za158]|nr:hypothetical protein C0992_006635 [Termitomyces sp. T32_za158]